MIARWFGKDNGLTPYQRSLVGVLVRVALVLGGGELLDEGQWEQVMGGLLILATVGWSAYQKLRTVPPVRLEPEQWPPASTRKPFKPSGKSVE
jgi:hypothetical protein